MNVAVSLQCRVLFTNSVGSAVAAQLVFSAWHFKHVAALLPSLYTDNIRVMVIVWR